jgi:hypothetical protein
MNRARRNNQPDEGSAMRDAYMRALKRRVDTGGRERCSSGTVMLPTGTADIAEIAKVLTAIKRARAAGDRR